jgi:hypothetical protein
MLVQIIRELEIPGTIDNMVQWDPKQCKHSPGTHVLAMMVNILMGRTALYRVEEFYENLDVPFLFGMDAHASDFNDSVLGRTLDKIFEAGPKRVFSAAALRAAMREDVKVDVVHVDTTSWSLAGIYADSVAESEALHITYGFSKDKRPDLKQFNYGLVVSRDGIPLIGEAMDGNTSDKVWNRHIIEELVSKLASDLDSLVYVADSAAVTKDNLDLIAEKGIKFISRLPATFKQEGMVKDRAWADGSWQELGVLTLNPKRDSAVYKCKDCTAEMSTALSGALAGLAGACLVMGVHRRLIMGISPGYGFDGILVSLLAGNNPAKVPFAALFYGYLRTGADLMESNSDVARELITIIQAVAIMFITAKSLIPSKARREGNETA